MNFLGIDAGTTCCKGVLFSETGEILAHESRNNALRVQSGETYLSPDLMWENVKSILRAISERYRIDTITFTSLGESFVALDEQDRIL